jgi:putative ABC transport system permease protein
MLKLIGHSIRMRSAQAASIAFMVFLGVAMLFSFILISSGVGDGVATAKERGGAEILLLPAKANNYLSDDALLFSGAPVPLYMSSDLFDKVRGFEGIERTTYQFFAQTLDASCCSASGETRLVGIDTASDWLVPTLLNDVTAWNQQLQDNQVILGSNVDGFEKGSGQVLGDSVTVIAVMVPTGTSFDDSIIVSAGYARRLSANLQGFQRFWEQNGSPFELISAILIDAQPDKAELLSAQLESLRDIRIVQRSNVIERSQHQLQTVFAALAAIAGIMALAALLQLSARYYSVAWERKNELALYRALGATKGYICRLICGEAFILTGVGTGAGLLAGAGLSALVLSQLASVEAFPFLMPSIPALTLMALMVVLSFMLITLLAIIVPLRKLSRIEPALALQQLDIS